MELAAFSDRGIGTRERLEDYAADRIIETAGGIVLQITLVCDGAGGGEAGELAARLTSRTIFEYLEISTETAIPQLLIKAVEQANKAVYNELRGAGTGTVALAAVHLNDESAPYGRLFIAHVGNSRIYLIRNGQLIRLNIDHTLANEYIYAGQMSAEEARQLDAAEYVTRSIGIGAEVNVDIGFYAERGKELVNSRRAFRIGQKGMKLQEGDTIFAASDGLFPYINDEEFLKHALDDNVERATRTLLKYAADRGPEDNIALSLLFVPSRNRRTVRTFERFSRQQRAGIAVFLLAIAMLIGILGLRIAGGESERTAFLVTQTFVQQLILESSYTPTPLPSPTPTQPFVEGQVGDRYTQSLTFPVFAGRYIDPLQPDEINYISIAGSAALSGGSTIRPANLYLQPGSAIRLNQVIDVLGSEQIDLLLKRGSDIFVNPGAFGSGGITVGLEQNPEIRMQSQNACMSIRQISADFSDPSDTDKVEVTCYGGNCTYRLPNIEPEVIPPGQQTLLNVDNPQLISTAPANVERILGYADTIYKLAPLQRDQLDCLSEWLDDDNDGVNYPLDLCPDESAPGSNDGCLGLDFDEDGVFGNADVCPAVAGPPENDGCPLEGPEATQRVIILTQMAIAQKSATPTPTPTLTLTPTPTLTSTPTATPTATPIPLPEARDDEYAVLGDEILSIPAPGVLANDILNEAVLDPLNNVTTRGGTISLRSNGSFTYTPPEDFVGLDSFEYTLVGVNGSDSALVVIDVLKPPAEPPVAAFTVFPGSGPVGAFFTITDASTGPINSYLWDFGDGSTSVSSIPDPHAYSTTGTFTITLTVTGPGGESTAAQAVTVFAIPIAVDDSFTTDEGQALSGNVMTNDVYFDKPALTASAVTFPSLGTLALSANGDFTYTPNNADVFGEDGFIYEIRDSAGNSDQANVYIEIRGINDPPVAVNDTSSTRQGQTLTVSAPGVLANDIDIDSPQSALRVASVTGPSGGGLTMPAPNGDGSFTYNAPCNAPSQVTFTYRVSDGAATSVNEATVTINVAVNNQINATNAADVFFVNEGSTGNIFNVLLNDQDPDGDTLSVVSHTGLSPARGTLTRSGNQFTYDAPTFDNANSANNTITFTYTVNDGCPGPTVLVTINIVDVNNPPVANGDSYTTSPNTALVVPGPGVLSNDTDADAADTLTAILAGNGTTAEGGTVVLQANGSFTYTPPSTNPVFTGTDSFQYVASDGQTFSDPPTTVTINVAQRTAVDNIYTMASRTDPADPPLTIAVPGVLDNDIVTSGTMTVDLTLVPNPSDGSVTLNADGSFTYTPDVGFVGTDSFQYRFINGGFLSNEATVFIVVGTTNAPPTAIGDSYTMFAGTTLVVPGPTSLPLLLDNDTDADAGDTLTAVLVGNGITAQGGTVTVQATGGFTYTPPNTNPVFIGVDSFQYQANDGTVNSAPAIVTITVDPIVGNVAPTAINNVYEMPPNTFIDVPAPGVLGNDIDVNGDALTANLLTNPANGVLIFFDTGSFIYTPNFNFTGQDSFTYEADDGTDTSAPATVTINVSIVAVNDTQTTFQDTPITFDVLANDIYTDINNTFVFLMSFPDQGGALFFNGGGSLTYYPPPGFTGSESFTYLIVDNLSFSSPATVTITVQPIINLNTPPVANDDLYGTAINVPLDVLAPGVLGNDADADGDPLTANLVSGTTTAQGGSVTLNADGSFAYTPPLDFTGLDTFTYQANDGIANSPTATVTIDVGGVGVNLPPVANNDAYITTISGTLDVNALSGVLRNDTDANGDTLTAVLVTGIPANRGTLVLNADGSFSYTPPNNRFRGIVTFTYVANDGQLDSVAPATVTIAVNTPLPTPVPIEVPAPPPATRCTDTNFENPGMIRSNFLDDEDRANLFCRLIAAGGNYMYWFGSPITHGGNIGDRNVIDLGLIAAVDVFSMSGVTRFVNDVNICLQGSGYIIYMNVSGQPRVPQLWNAWTTPSFPGYTCTTLYAPGTVILVANKPD